ncbi:FKRP protein, partial [Urocolius indicus]|nr:FKRP protein [Urocolius indicus]
KAEAPFCPSQTLPRGITVLLRDFQPFAHDLVATSASFSSLGFPVVVTSETPPYPPVSFPPGVRFVALNPLPSQSPVLTLPGPLVATQHVALVPDGCRGVPGLLERMRDELDKFPLDSPTKMVAAPVGSTPPGCFGLRLEPKAWTVRYLASNPLVCHVPRGPSVLLLRSGHFFSLPFPLVPPTLLGVSFQAAFHGWNLQMIPQPFPSPPAPPLNPHLAWKSQKAAQGARRRLMERLGLKLEVLADGGELWHGCGKDTPRCFGTIHSQTPEYLLRDLWTPPCCLKALRETAKHVVEVLEEAGVRYWLEGGSLLGAVRSGDIIPWDYDVDLGFYREDLVKCSWLVAAAAGRAGEDPKGFYWEKAPEGEFYRVHFSRWNRLHVDLWPFYPRAGGVMTKDTWLGHPQDVEFPESFLQPLVPLEFGGFMAMAPNDARGFLELKFGPGAIERPQYP